HSQGGEIMPNLAGPAVEFPTAELRFTENCSRFLRPALCLGFENLDDVLLFRRNRSRTIPAGQSLLVQLAHHGQRPNWLISVGNDSFQKTLIVFQHVPDGLRLK